MRRAERRVVIWASGARHGLVMRTVKGCDGRVESKECTRTCTLLGVNVQGSPRLWQLNDVRAPLIARGGPPASPLR